MAVCVLLVTVELFIEGVHGFERKFNLERVGSDLVPVRGIERVTKGAQDNWY